MLLQVNVMLCDDISATAPFTFCRLLTNTDAVMGVPLQPSFTGVIVKVTVTGALVVLVSVSLMFPDPLAAIPVTATVLFLVQV